MAVVRLEASKAKIAKRVIEVFEFFGTGKRPATVMDIARHYGRPQSSTSELLSSLVEVGLLYKDPASREFKPTPRLATMGVTGQPDIISDGRLFNYMDLLARSTRQTVALFGAVGTHVQIFRWLPAPRPVGREVGNGYAELLSSNTAGQLLLSTLDPAQVRGRLWRLNAEAPEDEKFVLPTMVERVAQIRHQGYAIGAAGFIPDAQMSAVLLPVAAHEPALALGVIHGADSAGDGEAYVATLKHGIGQLFPSEEMLVPKLATPVMRAV